MYKVAVVVTVCC